MKRLVRLVDRTIDRYIDPESIHLIEFRTDLNLIRIAIPSGTIELSLEQSDQVKKLFALDHVSPKKVKGEMKESDLNADEIVADLVADLEKHGIPITIVDIGGALCVLKPRPQSNASIPQEVRPKDIAFAASRVLVRDGQMKQLAIWLDGYLKCLEGGS